MSSTTMLSAAAADRKARLAQLKSLKRKQPSDGTDSEPAADQQDASPRPAKSPRTAPAQLPHTKDEAGEQADVSASILSGRNYDPLTKGPKLGFETNPSLAAGSSTIEQRAQALSDEVKAQLAAERETEAAAAAAAEAEEQQQREQQQLDLFKLRPKKPNWDLKRRLEERMRPVDVRTDNAIARLVRERIEGKRKDGEKEAPATAGRKNGSGRDGDGPGDGDGDGDGDAGELGIEGTTLVEATKEREREAEEDARRDREADAELGETS